MKKYLCMAAAGMLLFSACSNEDDVINNGNSSADFEGQELIMKVVNTGDGLTTRAARPLYSSEAGQKIDKVKLAIFKLNGLAIESCVFEKHSMTGKIMVRIMEVTPIINLIMASTLL